MLAGDWGAHTYVLSLDLDTRLEASRRNGLFKLSVVKLETLLVKSSPRGRMRHVRGLVFQIQFISFCLQVSVLYITTGTDLNV